MISFFLYFLRKLLYALSVIVGVTFLIFVIFNMLVEDPALILLGKYATPKAMAALSHQLGLDKPWYLQYCEVLQSAFTFNFGSSWATNQPILKTLQQGGLVSLTVTLPAFLIGNGLLIYVSLWMTQYKGTIWDRLLVISCMVISSISMLVCILVGQVFFACKLKIFPIMGYKNGFFACMPYIILPTIILVLLHFCDNYRFYRTIMLDELYQDYVRTARAKGLAEEVILFKHVFKNLMVPILTTFVKDFPSLLFGSVVIENFFSIPGLGNLVIDAVSLCDFPTIKAVTIITAVVSVLCNIVGDVLYTLVDPRIKL